MRPLCGRLAPRAPSTPPRLMLSKNSPGAGRGGPGPAPQAPSAGTEARGGGGTPPWESPSCPHSQNQREALSNSLSFPLFSLAVQTVCLQSTPISKCKPTQSSDPSLQRHSVPAAEPAGRPCVQAGRHSAQAGCGAPRNGPPATASGSAAVDKGEDTEVSPFVHNCLLSTYCVPGAEQGLGVPLGRRTNSARLRGGAGRPPGQKRAVTTCCHGQLAAVTVRALPFSLTVCSQHGLRGAQPNLPQSRGGACKQVGSQVGAPRGPLRAGVGTQVPQWEALREELRAEARPPRTTSCSSGPRAQHQKSGGRGLVRSQGLSAGGPASLTRSQVTCVPLGSGR